MFKYKETMKVFMCERQGGYSGGLAVVAANSKEEAFKTFFEDDRYATYFVDKYDLDNYELLEDATQWRSSYYPLEAWFECKHLTANVDLPCVIAESGYAE